MKETGGGSIVGCILRTVYLLPPGDIESPPALPTHLIDSIQTLLQP